jgi:YfiH family protein
VKLDSPEFYLTTLDNGWTVGRFHALDEVAGVVHAVTTKLGLDVQLARTDHAGTAAKLADALGWSCVAFVNQVHGGVVLPVDPFSDPRTVVNGVSNEPRTVVSGLSVAARTSVSGFAGDADGLVTDRTGLGLMTRGADCPLILAVDPVRRVIGTAHASWRGTACRIADELVRQMTQKGAAADRIVACICPSAGPCCYEVGPDVLEAMTQKVGPHAAEFFRQEPEKRGQTRISGNVERRTASDEMNQVSGSKEKFSVANSSQSPFFLDLWSANRDQLLRAGLREKNIHISGICTMCANDVFPSHRREAAAAGRFVAAIGLGSPKGRL